MALFKCPECGRQISDKAVSCPGCGYPVQLVVTNNGSAEEQLIDEVWARHPYSKTDAMRELQKNGMSLKDAKRLVDQRYNRQDAAQVIADKKVMDKNKSKQSTANLINSLQTLSNLGTKDKTARCPKCGSTSIQYTNKKLSLGRALVGDAVAGPTGAVLGGLSSKKGYVVCLKCGKQWKI